MRTAKLLRLSSVLTALMLVAVLSGNILAETPPCLSVKHQITTTGLPLVGPVEVYNVQEIRGDNLCRAVRSSTITMGDSVVSDVRVITITDFENKKQIYINPKTKTYASYTFNPENFPVIDSAEDARRPQMIIKETGEEKKINDLNCRKIYFKLDRSSNTGVGDAKVKHYFEGSMWITRDLSNSGTYIDYNEQAHKYLRGTSMSAGAFFDILARLDVDAYNLVRLVDALDGIPVEGSFVAQLPSGQGSNVFETKIKMIEFSDKPIDQNKFGPPTEEGYNEVEPADFRAF